MAVEIGALRALLSLDSAAFEQGAKRAKASMSTLGKVTSSAAQVVARAGRAMALGVTAVVAGLSAGAVSASRSFQELANQARIAGLGAEEFKVLSLAAREFGIEQDKLSDILKDVNDKFGDYAATGAGPLADFFENIAPQVGLTLDAFEGLSSSDALRLYVKALEDANVSQQEMTFYMEALASDATALIPLFQDNGAAIAEMAERARELGLSLDQDMVEAAAKARSEFSVVADVMKTQLGAALTEIIPVLAELANSVIPILVTALRAIEPVIGAVAALLRGDFMGAWNEASAGVSALVEMIVNLLTSLVERARQAVKNMVTAVVQEITFLVQRTRQVIADFGNAIVTTIREAAVAAVEAARQLGTDLIEGLKAGIMERFEAVRETIRSVPQNIISIFRRETETQSPSRVFAEIGGDLMAGLALGIAERAELAAAAAAEAAVTVVSAADQAVESAGPSRLEGIFDQVSNSIADAIVMGKNLGESLKKVFLQIARDFIASGIKRLIGNLFGPAPSGGSGIGSIFPFAKGGIVSGATPFAFGGGNLGVMGEAGPEAILPLSRGPGGKLGVNASGSSAPVNVVVNNYSSEQADVRQNGQDIEVIIGRVISKDIQNGGPTYRAMRKTFGLRQPVTTRG